MNPKEFDDAKLLWKMFYAGQCFMHAQAAAEYVLQKNIEEGDALYYPLITGIYVLYAKPFKKSCGVSKLGDEIIPSEHFALHHDLLDYRDQLFAHSDAKAFELPDVGQVNQVRLVRRSGDKSLFCSQFQANPTLMPLIINLCQQLQEKTEKQKTDLFKRYEKYVPTKVGEYVLNIYDPNGDFFTPGKTVIEHENLPTK